MRSICLTPVACRPGLPRTPTRSSDRANSIAAANAISRARSAFGGRSALPLNCIDLLESAQKNTEFEVCISLSRTKWPSDLADRRQSIMRAGSPSAAALNCQNSSPVPLRRRPWVPGRMLASDCLASAGERSKPAIAANARRLRSVTRSWTSAASGTSGLRETAEPPRQSAAPDSPPSILP